MITFHQPNIKIIPLFQAIRVFGSDAIPLSTPSANYFELFLINYLSQFAKLMRVYGVEETQILGN
jgi:hypothetical protein